MPVFFASSSKKTFPQNDNFIILLCLTNAFREVKQIQNGEKEAIALKDFLDELEDDEN